MKDREFSLALEMEREGVRAWQWILNTPKGEEL
jgi:hypothetical protein